MYHCRAWIQPAHGSRNDNKALSQSGALLLQDKGAEERKRPAFSLAQGHEGMLHQT